MRRGLLSVLFFGAVMVTGQGRARADAAAAEAEAQARFEEGIARVKAHDFDGARVSFAQANALLQRPYILWNLALAEEKSGHLLDALAHFKEFAGGVPAAGEHASAEKHVVDIMAAVGHIEVQAAPGAQILVDGTPLGLAPLSDLVDVLPGRHRIEARTEPPGQPGQTTRREDAEVQRGQTLRANLTAIPEVPVVGAPVSPQASPPPAVSSARNSTGPRPPSEGLMETARPPDMTSADLHSSAAVSTGRVITVAALGAAALGSVGLGAFFGLQSLSERDSVTASRQANLCSADSPTACASQRNAINAQNRDAALSNGLYVGGGLFAVGAVVTWFAWPRQAQGTAVRLLPSVGRDGAGVAAAGYF